MTEPEVSIRLALYYIENGLTDENVVVSIDGCHVKMASVIHFPIYDFLESVGCRKTDNKNTDRWQGSYSVEGSDVKLEIVSTSGIGDVVVKLKDGRTVYAECKKGKDNKSNQEYPLMREAIGQLMTGITITENYIPMVAVPYSKKSYELASRWSGLEQMKRVGIQFALVHDDGVIDFVK